MFNSFFFKTFNVSEVGKFRGFVQISTGNFNQSLVAFLTGTSVPECNRIAALDCIIHLCLSEDAKFLLKIAKFFGPHFLNFMDSESENYLVIKSCYAIGNLTHGAEKDKIRELLQYQGVFGGLIRIFSAKIQEIQETGALIFAVSGFVCSKSSDASRYADEILEQSPNFAEILVSTLQRSFSSTKSRNKSELLETHGPWLLHFIISLPRKCAISTSGRACLSLSSAVSTLADLLESMTSSIDYRLSSIIPLIRAISNSLALSSWPLDSFSPHFFANLCEISGKILVCQHVALRKEMLWLLCNLVSRDLGGKIISVIAVRSLFFSCPLGTRRGRNGSS